MKLLNKLNISQRLPRHLAARQGGAVIIVVVSLLTMLVFLGLFFYTWTAQERTNSEQFAFRTNSSATALENVPISSIYGHGMSQVLVSTPGTAPDSALWGNKWSMIAHMIGPTNNAGEPLEKQLYSGEGIGIRPTGDTTFDVDYQNDNVVDANQGNFMINFSRTANSGTENIINVNPAAGYTYPDINSLFLAVDYIDPISKLRIVKPSFALPGYFPGRKTPGGFNDWYTNASTVNQVLRPHQSHVYTSGNPRYLNVDTGASSGDLTRTLLKFPFIPTGVSSMGVWDNTGEDYTLFDADMDGDGIKDSIAIDLGHPIIDIDPSTGGREVVPIYYFKIVDMDGLLNANAHGHMPEFQYMSKVSAASITDDIYNRTTSVHESNLGLSPAEVNPSIALYADPNDFDFLEQSGSIRGNALRDDATVAHRGMLNNISATFDRVQMSNMEMAMLLIGQPQFNPVDVQPLTTTSQDKAGRYGRDGGLLRTSLTSGGMFPSPGVPNVDDDANSNLVANIDTRNGGIFHNSVRLGFNIPGFVHPLDFSGLGDSPLGPVFSRTAGFEGERIFGTGGLSNNALRWPTYPVVTFPDMTDHSTWQDQGIGGATISYREAVNGVNLLQQGPASDYLRDEADEVNIDSATNDDQIFPDSEIAGLHLSEPDWQKARMSSRLRGLAPFNFENNRLAHRIRSQFTSESWDRLQFAFGYSALNRDWEFEDTLTAGENRFPPAFGGAASRHENTDGTVGSYVSPTIDPFDPFRPEVRRLLTVRLGATSVNGDFPQRALNINRILSDDFLAGGDLAFDTNSTPQYRDLIPHTFYNVPSGELTSTYPMVHDHVRNGDAVDSNAMHPYNLISTIDPTTDSNVLNVTQEWWARYDRQRLARDIYVLLYTLAAHDGTNVDNTNTTTSAAIDATVAREMAQFAVNYVDALDRDTVITKFVYDANLSDGWASAPTETVFGVEAQELAFSEVLCVQTEETSADNPRTLHKEESTRHRFLLMEVRNVSPFNVPLDDNSWRIVRKTAGGLNAEVAVTFNSFGGTSKIIKPGENFLIGCHDGGVVNGNNDPIGAELFLDYTGGTELEAIAPKGTSTITDNSTIPGQRLDFDTSITSTDVDFRSITIIDGSYTGTTLVESIPSAGTAPTNFDLVLQRRANPGPPAAENNEWIEVDRFEVTVQDLNIDDSTSQADIATELNNIRSVERRHPLARGSIANNASAAVPYNTMDTGTATDRSQTAAVDLVKNLANSSWVAKPIWQPHFDRDFSSKMELLSIPLYGPNLSSVADITARYSSVTGNLLNPSNKLSGHLAAQERFLNPLTGTGGNRWYRLLNFLEVPPRTQERFPATVNQFRRTPGRINLNTLRHEHVFAGLIDDDIHHDPFATNPTDDLFDGSNRNWMKELILGRDGRDSTNVQQPPGTHLAQPFKPLNVVDPVNPNQSLKHTILRKNITGTSSVNQLGLLEARDTSDLTVDDIDYHSRNRLLSKVDNNSTTRSHVFGVWAGFALHDAHTLPSGDVQIGGPSVDLPLYRKFYVVDMSLVEEAFVDPHFDWRDFIIHEQTLP